MTTTFVNAQEMHRENPDRFEVPSTEELKSIKAGHYVKVATGNERFWVHVTEVTRDSIKGKVNNDLMNTDIHGLKACDDVEFTTDNIYDIYPVRKIKVSYQKVTPESAEEGDISEQGWINEDGIDMEPLAEEIEIGLTAVIKAFQYLTNEGVSEYSNYPFTPGGWYSTSGNIDPKDCAETIQSYHLCNFDEEEQKAIYEKVFPTKQ